MQVICKRYRRYTVTLLQYVKDSDANLCTCGKVLPSDSNAAMHALMRLYANECGV